MKCPICLTNLKERPYSKNDSDGYGVCPDKLHQFNIRYNILNGEIITFNYYNKSVALKFDMAIIFKGRSVSSQPSDVFHKVAYRSNNHTFDITMPHDMSHIIEDLQKIITYCHDYSKYHTFL